MHPYKENIDGSTRTKLKINDIIQFRSDNHYLPKIYKNQIGVVTERYRTLNRFNRRFWNYFTRIKVLTGPHEGRERSFISGGSFMKKITPIQVKKPVKTPMNLETIYETVEYRPATRKDQDIGTSFKGYLGLTYDEIVEIFGEPKTNQSREFSKVDWEWSFYLNNQILHIYNYKTGPSYCKENKNVKPQDVKYWHIGSHGMSSVSLLNKYINQQKKTNQYEENFIYDHSF